MNVGSRKTLNMFRNSHRDGKNEIGQHARVTAVNFCVAGENLNRLFLHATIGLKTTASEGKELEASFIHIWLDSLFIHNDEFQESLSIHNSVHVEGCLFLTTGICDTIAVSVARLRKNYFRFYSVMTTSGNDSAEITP
ncbi:uncharacterized protein EV154DRAFT_482163 [Mucor mucedo]|uniref:uncharacterized protein n=1 Tax=Mucor mucedo TaxID=29922 RepID=UPI00221FD9E1|nr:uncharacterized protein EV154DRAFT_482163 [Mucor mucedo]KAI7890439.1 hypothetical protein EV154DRAFT_482163 [Mucor mucedo]